MLLRTGRRWVEVRKDRLFVKEEQEATSGERMVQVFSNCTLLLSPSMTHDLARLNFPISSKNQPAVSGIAPVSKFFPISQFPPISFPNSPINHGCLLFFPPCRQPIVGGARHFGWPRLRGASLSTMTCLAIVLNGPKTKNGRRVFDSFKFANQQQFWNGELTSAADSLIYMGFMRPGTLFVSAPSVHLQALKSAWARRVLKPAEGYQIASVGDLGAIQPVEQMHFVPLGDVICDTIAQLNRLGLSASLPAIRAHVCENCPQVASPSLEMVRQTVASLTATGLVYRMGEHHFVSVPTKSPQQTSKQMTVECQTGTSIILPEKKSRKGLLARIFTKRSPVAAAPAVVPQPVAFSTEFPPPQWMLQANNRVPEKPSIVHNKFPTFNDRLCDQIFTSTDDKKQRRQRRRDRRQLSSSSECLNYGPIDPPECLPGNMEVVDEMPRMRRRKRTQNRKAPARTSTPVETDSAYSPSPVTDSNEEQTTSWSEPEEVRDNHTYINLRCDSTQFEDISLLPVPNVQCISSV